MGQKRATLAAVIAVVLATGGMAIAQEGGAAPIPKPTKEHDLLKKDLGTWDATIKSWMDPSKTEPEVSKGTETNTMLPGGLWMLSEFKGEFAGMPFHGRGQYSYDPGKKKYVGTWIDSMTTSPMLLEGTFDDASHSLTYNSDSVGPDGKPYKMKNVSTYRADGSRVVTMHMKSEATGPDFVKVMEITYTKHNQK